MASLRRRSRCPSSSGRARTGRSSPGWQPPDARGTTARLSSPRAPPRHAPCLALALYVEETSGAQFSLILMSWSLRRRRRKLLRWSRTGPRPMPTRGPGQRGPSPAWRTTKSCRRRPSSLPFSRRSQANFVVVDSQKVVVLRTQRASTPKQQLSLIKRNVHKKDPTYRHMYADGQRPDPNKTIKGK